MKRTNTQQQLLAQVENLLNIGIALSAEKDHNRLLRMIVTEARQVTNADAGTLYFKGQDSLTFKIIQNHSLNIDSGGAGEPINIPPVPLRRENVSSYVAITGETINIADVYQADGFDFSGPRRYDQMTGYRTMSMLVVPLENHQAEIIGVLQLINALDSDNTTVIPFAPFYEKVVKSLASQAAIALTNAQLIKDIQQLFNSFVEAMATAIDSRTPYNANHTRRVALLAEATAQVINTVQEGLLADITFDQKRLEQLSMAAWLHDIGKIATPLSVMDKSTRLGDHLDLVLQRLDYIYQSELARSQKHQLELLWQSKTDEAGQEVQRARQLLEVIKEAKEVINKTNNPATFVDDDLIAKLTAIAALTYFDQNGSELTYLTSAELENLSIRKGTLTNGERQIMEDHVIVTDRMLEKIPFTKNLCHVRKFASMHHEHLDGKGYPQGLQAEDIPLEPRILALVDVFDALTAQDRPYKKALPVGISLKILREMADQGKIDRDLLDLFVAHKVWERVE